MSTEKTVKKYTTSDSRHNARNTLLDAITRAAVEVEESGRDTDSRTARLKELAEVYALVVHGKE
ncbi:hypothetical protein [Streptomyces ardesiacus]|uniref:hypothetical protein n=1 Tax=Streptomyces ardesiacus TaxID=285564 RepID=UPI002FDC08A5